jgi:hypothetical protein
VEGFEEARHPALVRNPGASGNDLEWQPLDRYGLPAGEITIPVDSIRATTYAQVRRPLPRPERGYLELDLGDGQVHLMVGDFSHLVRLYQRRSPSTRWPAGAHGEK